MKSLTLVTIISLFATTAFALQIDPRCRNMRDKIGCTCALQNGGGIDARNHWWSRPGQTVNEAFVQCSLKAKGRNP
jgi:hypothetical protein